MLVAHVYETERIAHNEYMKFLDRNNDAIIPKKKGIVFECYVDGDHHCFMGCEFYTRWCKGREYFAGDDRTTIYRSGYVLKRAE